MDDISDRITRFAEAEFGKETMLYLDNDRQISFWNRQCKPKTYSLKELAPLIGVTTKELKVFVNFRLYGH